MQKNTALTLAKCIDREDTLFKTFFSSCKRKTSFCFLIVLQKKKDCLFGLVVTLPKILYFTPLPLTFTHTHTCTHALTHTHTRTRTGEVNKDTRTCRSILQDCFDSFSSLLFVRKCFLQSEKKKFGHPLFFYSILILIK